MNEVINRQKKTSESLPSKFIYDGEEITTEPHIAERFNHFFSSIGDKLASEIPFSDSCPTDFLPSFGNTSIHNKLETSQGQIEEIIKSLNRVGGGIDKINSKILLLTYKNILENLTFFFNLCLKSAVFPQRLKMAIIKPIFKSGERNNFNNYRPISLLPLFSKVLEKLLHSYLSYFLEENKILHGLQFGFRKKHSTYMPIALLYDKITNNLQMNKITCCIYLDLKKAFDTVSFDILLGKIHSMGIQGPLFNILQSYLTNRKQRTHVNSYVSSDHIITMDVPQGSILGPLLFILYINDLPKVAEDTDAYLFADDTAISIGAKDSQELQAKIDEILPKISNWFNANQLSLNTSKTHYQVFFSKRSEDELMVKINGCKISRQFTVKYLGVYIDENLKWNTHIEKLVCTISRNIGVIGRAKPYLSSNQLHLLYSSLVLPYISYCAAIWGANYSTSTSRIVKLQKRAIRIIDKKPYLYPTSKLFTKYKILKLPELVKEQSILILLGKLNNSLPNPLSDIFTCYRPVGTRAAQHFKLPYAATNYRSFSLSHYAPKTWNHIICKLFKDIENVPRSKYILKKHIREYMLKQYSDV